MLTPDENKAVGKSGQRGRKTESPGGKVQSRNRKSGQQRSSKSDRPQDAEAQISAPVAPTDSIPGGSGSADIPPIGTAAADIPTVDTGSADNAPLDVAPADVPPTSPTAAPVAAESVAVSFQTIASAYGDYTNKSLEQTRSFFENLAGVRSLDKAFVLQADFARQAYETFVAESEKIRGLHRELARQRLRSLEGFMASMTENALLMGRRN